MKIVTELASLPVRADTAHKGATGRVAIVAGSAGMSGAAVLAGLGALRSGAGLVKVCTPACVQPLVAAAEPCLLTAALPDQGYELGVVDERQTAEILTWAGVLAIGPGLGVGPGATGFVRAVLRGAAVPLVLDADALNILSRQDRDAWKDIATKRLVLTPHPGEMNRLLTGLGLAELSGNQDDRIRAARDLAVATGATVVLKGQRTVVCDGESVYVNTTGNPGMASGGMGDVLTGVLAGLLAQRMGTLDAACLGVLVHGLAGDICAQRIGRVGFSASEVARAVPEALSHSSRPRVGFLSEPQA